MPIRLFALICLLFGAASATWAAIDTFEFETEVQRQRYLSFVDEMRCPNCQSQNLAGSDSPIANDLRREVYTMIMDGQSDREIVDHMVARYGDYILYRPRLSPVTVVLWFGPPALLIIGIVILILMVYKRRGRRASAADVGSWNEDADLAPQDQERLAALLERRRNNDSGGDK
ncbi:cytochrome c-type biogenesis protein [Marinimicrobium alkaliphilum]|uniref:cytochrome c-type biogenesis protein n=1 Tax=Marinimicrobium alkaliphilum TaxID=2202654 RepID=UPI000DBAB5B3|nr:cytochrome c-type biogenesis protein [Marinimicrobium alkaliphilum]